MWRYCCFWWSMDVMDGDALVFGCVSIVWIVFWMVWMCWCYFMEIVWTFLWYFNECNFHFHLFFIYIYWIYFHGWNSWCATSFGISYRFRIFLELHLYCHILLLPIHLVLSQVYMSISSFILSVSFFPHHSHILYIYSLVNLMSKGGEVTN